MALGVAWLVCVLGWMAVFAMPDVYEARARVFVDTSSRLREVLGTIAFDPDVDSRVNTVRQAMLGRPQLERVATSTGLVDRAETAEDRERLIDGLVEKIEIRAGRSNSTENLFQITYRDPQPKMAVSVVDSLLTAFVEDVVNQKEEGSEAAQGFLRDQIQHYSEQLSAAEQRLAQFKKENVGLMPGESGDYFSNLQAEQTALEDLKAQLRVAESKRDRLRQQLRGEDPFAPAGTEDSTDVVVPGSATDTTNRIAELQRQLDDLRLRFTDKHPDVIRTREQLERLREQRQQELQLGRSSEGGLSNATNPVYQQVQIALNDANVQIAELQAKIDDREARIQRLRGLLDTMPEIEAKLSQLNRDYANTKSIYDSLVAQLERERLVNEGDEHDVINFEVIDPPKASVDPVAPRRVVMLVAVLVVALGIGGGAAYLMNLLKPVFTDTRHLRAITGLPVIGAVSAIPSRQALQDARADGLSFTALATLLVAAAVLAVVFREAGTAFLQTLLA